MVKASIINWYGGKHYLLKHILPLIPEHEIYVEVFGGAGHLLFAKPPAQVNVYNDIDSNLVNFFRVLRDPEKAKRLQELLYLTPYSREEFEFCREHLNDPGVDDVECARRFFVAVRQSFNSKYKTWGYILSNRTSGYRPRQFFNYVDRIPEFTEKLRHIQVEHGDFEQVMRRYDTPRTFFYCDPPYVTETLKTPQPYKTMRLGDHMRLVKVLLSIRGKAMLSGYDHEVYRPLEESGWLKIKLERHLFATNARMNLRGLRAHQNEYLWLNYEPPKHEKKPQTQANSQPKLTEYFKIDPDNQPSLYINIQTT
jgi:DNA adenine methylase